MMDHTYDIETIKQMFAADHFANAADIKIDSVSDEHVVCSMKISDVHKNAAGGVQGGAIFTLCDFTFAVHSNLGLFRGDGSVNVVQSCAVSFLKATRGAVLYSRSTLLHKGRTSNVYRVEVTDDLGASITEALFNGFATGRLPGERAIP